MRREGLLAEPIIRDPSMSKALWQITFHRADRANFCMARQRFCVVAAKSEVRQPHGACFPSLSLPQPAAPASIRSTLVLSLSLSLSLSVSLFL
jgi:hypothetical protein